MNASVILLGFLETMLTCAVVVLVAVVIKWVLQWMGVAIDGDVLRWGRIVVGLICLIVVVAWLLSLIGGGGAVSYHPLFRW